MKTPHSSTYRGKKVRIELKNGESFIAKFKEKHGNTIKFYDHPDVWSGNLKMFAIYKKLQHEN